LKYTIFYQRKVRAQAYEMLEIGLSREFDTSETPTEAGFAEVRDRVNAWIDEERERLLEKEAPR